METAKVLHQLTGLQVIALEQNSITVQLVPSEYQLHIQYADDDSNQITHIEVQL